MDEGFQPLDAIRSSYGLQRRVLAGTIGLNQTEYLFSREENSMSEIARACTVYSMVPYLGILFVPFALATASFGYIRALQLPDNAGRRTSLACMGVSLLLLAIQLVLWWLLYLIPEIGI